ncbi:MAG: hypothetical protein ABII88_00050 [Candidatus Omnitrophota bacterium]
MRLMLVFFSTVIAICLFSFNVVAGDIMEIDLIDGSVIVGEIDSLVNGIYTINSSSIGEVNIDESRVKTVRSSSWVNTQSHITSSSDSDAIKSEPTPLGAVNAGVEALKSTMANNKSIMGQITELQNDPEFMAILNDPKIMSAVQSGDIEALKASPKFMRLLDNSAVQEIDGELNN